MQDQKVVQTIENGFNLNKWTSRTPCAYNMNRAILQSVSVTRSTSYSWFCKIRNVKYLILHYTVHLCSSRLGPFEINVKFVPRPYHCNWFDSSCVTFRSHFVMNLSWRFETDMFQCYPSSFRILSDEQKNGLPSVINITTIYRDLSLDNYNSWSKMPLEQQF